jgi:hypothetical protein
MDKKVERFAAKPGQAPGDANAARAKLVRARDYAAETEEVLRAMRSNAR